MTAAEHPVPPDRETLARRLCARYDAIIDDPDALVRSLLRPLPTTVWANPRRLSRDDLLEVLRADGIAATPMAWSNHGVRLDPEARPGRHWGFMAGLFQVQEEVSMLPVALLDPQPGERVLDLCAAPGNKTAQIAMAMANRGTVMANDLRKGRLAALRQTVKRLGLMNVVITAQDGQSIGARAGAFDRVLVDAPCSCEGTFRKVRLPTISTAAFRSRLAAVQVRLLERAMRLTRPGGRLVYSTCTLAPEENEAVIDTLLDRYPGELRVVPAHVPGLQATAGITQWEGRRYDPAVADTLRVWPHHNDTGGFFVAVLERSADANSIAEPHWFTPPEEPRSWLEPLTERFGIPWAAFDGAVPVKRGNKHLHLAPVDHRYPEAPAPEMLGLPAVRRRSLPVKPTTAAAMLYGPDATRNVITLDTAQTRRYLERHPIQALSTEQLAACTSAGYVVLRYRGYTLGLGQLIFDRETGVAHVESLMPKAWSRDPTMLMPPEEG
ncbi:RsmB/NOP family class I SAM-dependent RNA methyltransferase [Aquisalimonas sp.]|uniref:RsmB/NOP family class I SAM-dependent RNA methyltransferase n=2 Tax=Aquisalimonas sp. TaxID=1872621 RepID=UPI0025BA8822|nr:RsmB/NOP family class I SAM-dependent RNA methyltransferase [Aquisalimonas sp.]